MVSLQEIEAFLKQEKLEYRVQAAGEVAVQGFSSLDHYQPGTLTWIKSADRWKEGLLEIALCIVQEGVELPLPNQIICHNSKAVFFSLIEHFFAVQEEEEPIGRNTVIGPHVRLGSNVRIGHNCSITGDVIIGDDTVISDNVVIKNKVRIGKRCTIQALTMIGEDGFGAYEEENHRKVMIRHYGGVTIGDDVFIRTDYSDRISFAMATITIRYWPGYDCCVTINGHTEYAPDKSGIWAYPAYGPFTMTVAATYGEDIVERSVEVSADDPQSISLCYLYYHGKELSVITGGWDALRGERLPTQWQQNPN